MSTKMAVMLPVLNSIFWNDEPNMGVTEGVLSVSFNPILGD